MVILRGESGQSNRPVKGYPDGRAEAVNILSLGSLQGLLLYQSILHFLRRIGAHIERYFCSGIGGGQFVSRIGTASLLQFYQEQQQGQRVWAVGFMSYMLKTCCPYSRDRHHDTVLPYSYRVSLAERPALAKTFSLLCLL